MLTTVTFPAAAVGDTPTLEEVAAQVHSKWGRTPVQAFTSKWDRRKDSGTGCSGGALTLMVPKTVSVRQWHRPPPPSPAQTGAFYMCIDSQAYIFEYFGRSTWVNQLRV